MRAISTDNSIVPFQTVSTTRRPVLKTLVAAGTLGILGVSPFVRPVAATPPAELETDSGVVVRVRVPRQQVDGDTFSAEVVGREGGGGSGVLLVSTERVTERYLVEGARVVCEQGEPTAVDLTGTVVVIDHDGGATRGDFRARVEQSEAEECLIWDLGTSGVSQARTIEVEGTLRFAAGVCERTSR